MNKVFNFKSYFALELNLFLGVISHDRRTFLDWNYMTGAIVGFVIVTTYCIAGGFLAAAWTDMLPGAIMLACLVLLPVVAWLSLSNSDAIYSSLSAINPGLTQLWGPAPSHLET